MRTSVLRPRSLCGRLRGAGLGSFVAGIGFPRKTGHSVCEVPPKSKKHQARVAFILVNSMTLPALWPHGAPRGDLWMACVVSFFGGGWLGLCFFSFSFLVALVNIMALLRVVRRPGEYHGAT